MEHAVQGAPPAGVQGARSPLGLAQRTKNPLPKASIFLLFELRSSALHGPQKGA